MLYYATVLYTILHYTIIIYIYIYTYIYIYREREIDYVYTVLSVMGSWNDSNYL